MADTANENDNTNHNSDKDVNQSNDSTMAEEPPPPSYEDTVNNDPPRKQSNSPAVIDVTMDNGTAKGVDEDVPNGKPEKEANGEAVKEDDKKEKKDEYENHVGTLELFRFATAWDWFLIFWATVWSIANGVAFPLVLLFFGDVTDAFIGFGVAENFEGGTMPPSATTAEPIDPEALFEQVSEDIKEFAINYTILGVAVMIASYFQAMLWNMTATRQVQRLRLSFFHSVLRQEIGWFDTHESGEMNTRMNEDIDKIRDGIGDKLGIIIQWLTTAVGGFVLGFIFSWKLTLVILATSPCIGVAAGLMAKLVTVSTKEELDAYAKAGSIAEEVLSSIRTVVAFGGEQVEVERYSSNLVEAKKKGVKRNVMQSFSFGAIYMFMYGGYGLAFWYGTKLYFQDGITPGDILIVFFGVLFGAFSLGNAAPHFATFMTARGAASAIWDIIDQIPTIDSSSEEGLKPKELIGQIALEDVHFSYPSRKDVKVLNGLNLEVNVGQTVALVGSSGCGKSTVTNLVQRFYDVDEGSIKLDGNNLKDLNVHWLREHIGIVSQEPILFGTTIIENIRYGRLDVTNEEVVSAAKEANAHDFISALPDKYETLVGERGAQLSGGQKQRIAIARALVRNPRILLLDEATSALDTESEGVVQAALDKVQAGRTTIVIAHRLSTIKNADAICAFRDGVIVERGSHEELMNLQDGVYKELVMMQSRKQAEEGKKEEGETDEEELSDSDEDEKKADPLVKTTPASPEKQLSRTDSLRGSARKLKRAVSGMSGSSHTEKETQDMEKEDDIDIDAHFSFTRLMKMNSSEWFWMLLGLIGAGINGAMQPCFAIVFARVIGAYALPEDELRYRVKLFSILFVVIGVVIFISSLLQGFGLGISGESLTQRLRHMAFKAMLRQEISWFDDHKNSTGALTTRLSTEASQVQGATGARIGTMISALFNLGTGIIISFYYGWQLTLLVLAFLPLTIVASAIQWKIMEGSAEGDKATKEVAGKIAVEAVVNVRTVASLAREKLFFTKFKDTLEGPYKTNIKKAHLAGLAYGSSQCIMFFAYAAAFRLGGDLVERGKMEFDDVFLVFSAIVFGGFALGGATALAPDYAKAKTSAAHLLYLFDRVPAIDSHSTEGHKPSDYKAEVKFEGVKFRYPTRPDIPVLRGLTLSVNPGQTLALVGSSGCGKSTSVQLVERFYDTKAGEVLVDTFDVKVLNTGWLRSQIGLVSQEPILFDRTIAENIAYGDNTRKVEMDEIIEAAKKANIHDFIHKLPTGYETRVGDKGTQLSGGQKQRVAIARALVRNPRILLLDEATSALDTESERIVQAALDEAKKGRTCITIAHRLSTIHDAEKIAVIRHGRVAELGTHDELMKLKGQYYQLYTAQELHH